ncbi:MAG: hypothetical protein AAFZ18_36855 [Myxococcota bacterium]
MGKVTVTRVWKETPTLTGVRLDPPEAVRAGHTVPGQVISALGADGKKVFLALASVPGDPELELLAAPSAVEDLGFDVGQELSIEGPFGKGFPIEHARGKDVLLFAVGSALAPIRPVVELIRRERSEFGRVSLYAGALSAEAFPYRDQYDAWLRDRIDVVRVVDPEFVQDVFAADPLPVVESFAYVCWM